MLKSLVYSNTFPSTGRTLSGTIQFEKGFGTITGPNESGKSFILEMVRYCLFGTKALRGTADDYKKLVATLEFSVHGKSYVVARKNGGATLTTDDKVIATGARPVNDKLVSIFGYGLEVFDTANIANQNDLLKLGDMMPSDRKRMVDSVIGLGVIEDMGKWAGEQALAKTREKETIEKMMFKPVEPAEPVGYRHSTDLRAELDALLVLKSEHDNLQGALARKLTPPVRPKEKIAIESSLIVGFVEQQDALKARKSAIVLPPAPPKFTMAELDNMLLQHDAAERWDDYQRFVKKHPKPTHTKEQLDEMVQVWNVIQEYQRAEVIRKDLAKALAHGENCCPNCEHTWPVAEAEVLRLRTLVVDAPAVCPDQPALNLKEIAEENERLQDTADWSQWDGIVETRRPLLSKHEIGNFQGMWGRQGDREAMLIEIANIETSLASMPDYRAMYAERLHYENAMKRYATDLAEFTAWEADHEVKKLRVAELAPEIAKVGLLQAGVVMAVSYEASVAAYNTQLAAFEKNLEAVEALREEADGWKKAKASLLTLRLLVKQHLLPSLNKVASGLIKTMTGGQRQTIVVDDEFDVMVDNQKLNTLSGSGKALANLALRLGLGQVLTNGVFSVFIADEIDASLDAERAENTSLTLQLLKSRISQILLVTHKYPQSDYFIELGKSPHAKPGTSTAGTPQ